MSHPLPQPDTTRPKEESPAKSRVEVLLATYNGERFLREQMESILGQTHGSFRILVSDDGSKDGTAAILREFSARSPQSISLLSDSTPTGHPKRNFLRLMKASTADYLCFSDQDDMWLPEKISLTMQVMKQLEERHGLSTPALVFTDLRVVNERLEILNPSYWKRAEVRPENVHHLSRLLGENVVTGCTVMINRSLRDLAIQMPEEAEMHDWWVALLAATFGVSAIVREATVLYRQHASNVVGSSEQDLSLAGVTTRVLSNQNRRQERLRCERQAEALLRIHGEQMPAEKRDILEAYLLSGRSESAWTRIRTMARYGFFRGSFLKNIATAIDLLRERSIADPS